MLRAEQCFNSAKARGEEYLLIMQKKQRDAESLTFCMSGDLDEIRAIRGEFRDYSYVAILNTEQPWEDHRAYLDSLGFVW